MSAAPDLAPELSPNLSPELSPDLAPDFYAAVDAAIDAAVAQLWPHGDSLSAPQVHMLADGARDAAIAPMIRFGKLDFDCLFAEPLTPRLRAAAPYLVHLAAASAQSREMLHRCGDGHWGILISAPAHITTRQLRLHFKKLLWVHDEHGRRLNFRFYDPRVLSVYLPTCTQEERDIFFGPAEALYCLEGQRLRRYTRRA